MLELLGVVVAAGFMLFAKGATWLAAAELLVTFLLWGQVGFGIIWLLFTLISLLVLAIGGAVLGAGAGLTAQGGLLGALGGSILGGTAAGALTLLGSLGYLIRKAFAIGGCLMILRGLALLVVGGAWVVWIAVGAVLYLIAFSWYRRARRSSSD